MLCMMIGDFNEILKQEERGITRIDNIGAESFKNFIQGL